VRSLPCATRPAHGSWHTCCFAWLGPCWFSCVLNACFDCFPAHAAIQSPVPVPACPVQNAHSVFCEPVCVRAFGIARAAHDGRYRVSGEPAFVHCVEVARILAELGADEGTVSGAWRRPTAGQPVANASALATAAPCRAQLLRTKWNISRQMRTGSQAGRVHAVWLEPNHSTGRVVR
jgi:hypothetical protein